MQLEYRLNAQGPSSSASVGLGFLAESIARDVTGKDLGVDFITAAPAVEWASTINASIAPIYTTSGYSNEGECRVLLSMYHGIRSGPPIMDDRTKLIASEILSIGSKVPIVDFAEQVRKGDLARLRRLVLDISRHRGSSDELSDAISLLNAEVKAYERKEHLLNKIDLVGLGLDFAMHPPMSWFVNVISPAIERARTNNPLLGAFLDTIQGIKTLDPPHRPFIARLKKNLRDKIE